MGGWRNPFGLTADSADNSRLRAGGYPLYQCKEKGSYNIKRKGEEYEKK